MTDAKDLTVEKVRELKSHSGELCADWWCLNVNRLRDIIDLLLTEIDGLREQHRVDIGELVLVHETELRQLERKHQADAEASAGAVVEECVHAASRAAATAHSASDITKAVASVRPGAQRALRRRLVEARLDEAQIWNKAIEIGAMDNIGRAARIAELERQREEMK